MNSKKVLSILVAIALIGTGSAILIHNYLSIPKPDAQNYSVDITTFSMNLNYEQKVNSTPLNIYGISPDKHNFTTNLGTPSSLLVSFGVNDNSSTSYNISSIFVTPYSFKLVHGTLYPSFPTTINANNGISLTLQFEYLENSNYSGPLSIQLNITK
jgi:hypothetical protein